MPRVVIDNQQIDVPEGSTILDAARKLGLDIPALCHRNGHPPLGGDAQVEAHLAETQKVEVDLHRECGRECRIQIEGPLSPLAPPGLAGVVVRGETAEGSFLGEPGQRC